MPDGISVRVTMAAYSGRRNPTWTVSLESLANAPQVAAWSSTNVVAGLTAGRSYALRPAVPAVSGLRGFLLARADQHDAMAQPAETIVYGGTDVGLGDSLAEWLWRSAPGTFEFKLRSETFANATRTGLGKVIAGIKAPKYAMPEPRGLIPVPQSDLVWRRSGANCYAYANDKSTIGLAAPGNTTTSPDLGHVFTGATVLEMRRRLLEDNLDPIGRFEPTSWPSSDEVQIAVCLRGSPTNPGKPANELFYGDFHCLRRDGVGRWTHKFGMSDVTPSDDLNHEMPLLRSAKFTTPLVLVGFYVSGPGSRIRTSE